MLLKGAPGEDVPGEEIDFDAPVMSVLHDIPPEFDLFVDADRPDGFEGVEHGGANHVGTAM